MTRKSVRRLAAAMTGLTLLAAGTAAQTAAPQHRAVTWYASWSASPVDAHSVRQFLALEHDKLTDSTIRQQVRLSRGGNQLRIRISNEYATTPLHIGAASIGYAATPTGKIERLALRFDGARDVTIPAGAPMVSDPLPLKLADGADLEISLYLPDTSELSSVHPSGQASNEVWSRGDATMADTPTEAKPLMMVEGRTGLKFLPRLFISEVDLAANSGGTVVAFGDSITDGFASTPDRNHRWPDVLARRLAQRHLPLAVANAGISGNQLLNNGAGASALARFDRDVLALPGARAVIILEGINDIDFSGGFIAGVSRPDVIAAEELIRGYRQLIARAHANHLKVIGATLTPFEGSPAYTPDKEKVRQAVNAWIRTSGTFDAVADFDAASRDPDHPGRLKPDFDSGDHVHPSDAGYEAMGAAIALKTL